MPKTPITAKFIRVPVEGGRLPVAPAFNDFLDAKHMVVVELGMQKGNLLPEYFDAEKSAKMVDHKLLSAKRHSAFEGTDLEFLLKILGCKTIVFVGAGLDCIGMGTGFYGMIKDFKCLVVEDRFYPYFEDLGEECAKACTMFIGLVVRADELTAEIQAQGKE